MPTSSSGLTWLIFALLTVGAWGLYGIFLHTGQIAMGDPENGRYKAFLFVGIAYLVTAVIGSLIVLAINGSDWSFPTQGLTWSLLAGTVGAIGAFGVLLAFGAKGTPPVVMSIVFAGAPMVNAVVSLIMHPPAGGWGGLNCICVGYYIRRAGRVSGDLIQTFVLIKNKNYAQ